MHKGVVADLEQARAELVTAKGGAAEDQNRLRSQIAGLQEEKTFVSNELLGARSAASREQLHLEIANESLAEMPLARRHAEDQLVRLQDQQQQTARLSGELRRERDQVRNRTEDLQRQLGTAQHEIESGRNALAQAERRIAALDEEKTRIEIALADVRSKGRDLEVQLAAERNSVARISEEKQQLMSGTTTAQEEIARLQRRAGELEAKAVRVNDLEQRLSERDQEIGRFRQAVADRESLQAYLCESRAGND